MPIQNKINAPTPISTSNGGTSSTSFTAYGLLAAGTSSTGPLQSISPGTSGQIITSNGAGALPSFTTKSDYVLITTNTITSGDAAVVFTNISNTYSQYAFWFEKTASVTNNVGMRAQVSTDNGATYLATNYTSSSSYQLYNTTLIQGFTSATTYYLIFGSGVPNNVNFGTPAVLFGYNFGTATPTTLRGMYLANNNSWGFGGTQNSTNTINAIKFYLSSGNWLSGKIRMYGIKS